MLSKGVKGAHGFTALVAHRPCVLVTDRPELVEELKDAWLAGYRRLLEQSRGYKAMSTSAR